MDCVSREGCQKTNVRNLPERYAIVIQRPVTGHQRSSPLRKFVSETFPMGSLTACHINCVRAVPVTSGDRSNACTSLHVRNLSGLGVMQARSEMGSATASVLRHGF